MESHGSAHALASTARALRREATVLRDALRVQEELLRRRDEQGTATIAALSEILGRAGDRARAAVDHLHGEARRLRGRLDETHEKAVAGALAASAQILAELSERHGDGSPEDLESVRSTVADATRVRAQDWFAAADLDTAMRQAAVRAMESPRAELAQARWSTGELLQVELSDVVDLPGVEPPRTPSFEASVHPGWRSWSQRRSSVGYPPGCAAARCCASWRAGARRLSRAPSAGPARHCRTACARRTELPSAASRPPAPSTLPRCSRAWLQRSTSEVGRGPRLSRRWRTLLSASPHWTRCSPCWLAASRGSPAIHTQFGEHVVQPGREVLIPLPHPKAPLLV